MVEYSYKISRKIKSVVEELAYMKRISEAEIIRRSISIYHYLYGYCSSGGKISLKKDGEIRELLLQELEESALLEKDGKTMEFSFEEDKKSGLAKKVGPKK